MNGRSVVLFAVFSILILLMLVAWTSQAQTSLNLKNDSKKSAIVWMGLEITGENISADLSAIREHKNDLTGVSFEHYMIDSQGDLEPIFPLTNVTSAIQSDGLQTFPMIISVNLNDIEYLINHPNHFIQAAVSQAVAERFTGFNVDFEPTKAANSTVAMEYCRFLTDFADALHSEGKILTVDVATWNQFWNFSALGNTTTDILYDMGTYASPSIDFASALEYAAMEIPLSKLGIGLITVNVNNGSILANYSVSARFQFLESYNVTNVAVWDMPLNSYWWVYLSNFLGEKNNHIINKNLIIIIITILVAAGVSFLFIFKRKRNRIS